MRSENASAWPPVRLDELAGNHDRRRVPLSSSQRGERRGPYPYWGANGILDYVDSYLFDGPHVLLAEDGTVERADGRAVVHSPSGRFWVNNHAHVLVARAETSQRWLYYALSQIRIRPYLTGSVQAKLTQRSMNSIELRRPPLADQDRIAVVLGVLDDKIDSNRSLTGLLVALLSAVFRHRLSETSRDGWEAADLTVIARFVNGRAFTKHANKRGRPILRIKELNNGVTDATPLSDIKAQDDNLARHHDILFSWSGSLDIYRWHGPESLINQHIFKVLPNDGFPPWFVVGWIREHLSEFQAIARDKATTMGHIKREHLKAGAVSIPPRELLAELDETLSPLDEQLAILAGETRTLEQLRDALLPKLISGEIRVPDTADPEEVIGPAAVDATAAV